MTKRQLEEIFYFDQSGIDRLYNQLNSEIADIITKEIISSQEYSGVTKPEIGNGYLLEKFLPSIKIAFDLAHKRSKNVKTTEERSTSVEQRYIHLVDYLDRTGELRRSLRKAWLCAAARGGRSFCLFEAEFIPEPVPSNDWLMEANERKTLIVTDLGRQYRMGLGFSNIKDVYSDKLSGYSHTAIRLRNGAKLRVLGTIEKSKYIKPYVVSWI